MHTVELISTGDGQIMETLDNIGIKLFVLAALKEHEFYLVLFFCLCCVVPVSVQYRLCLVTVCVRVLHNGRLPRFSRGQIVVARLAGAFVTKMATLLGVSKAAVSKVMTTYRSWEDIIS
jgi:hypothetical protein